MSQKGSKENVAESNPLLEDDGAEKNGETPEKEEVEVEEKKDESNEKESKDDKKKKKEKKVKVPKVPKPKGPSCVETLSSGLDMTARDKDGINVEIDVSSSVLSVNQLCHVKLFLFSSTLLMFSPSPAQLTDLIPCGDCLSSSSATPSSGSTDSSAQSSSFPSASSGPSSSPSSPSSMSGLQDR